MKDNKPSFSLLSFLQHLINRFFAWISNPFIKKTANVKKPKKKVIRVVIRDAQGDIELEGSTYDDFLNQYLKIRNIPSSMAGELAPSKHPERYNYVPKGYLLVAIGKPNEEKETHFIRPNMLVSEFLNQYEEHHKIDQPGKLMIDGRIADPKQKVVGATFESLSNLHYIPFKPPYAPKQHQISIRYGTAGLSSFTCESTDTIDEVLAKFHKVAQDNASIPPEQMELLSFLGTDFKGQQTVDEILTLAGQQEGIATLNVDYKISPAPVVIRINYDHEIYRIECIPSETVPGILKKFHEIRHVRDEEGSLKALIIQKANDPQMQATPEVIKTFGKKLDSKTDEYDLDNTKTLAEQNITAGSYVSAEYKPKNK
jgi:hypothetical protein